MTVWSYVSVSLWHCAARVSVCPWRCAARSRPLNDDRLALPLSTPLSPPGDRCCQVSGFAPAGSVSSFSTLKVFHKQLPFVVVAFSGRQSIWSLCCPLFPSSARPYPPLRDLEGGCRTVTHASLGFPVHFSFCVARTLNESVRMMLDR